MRPHDRSWKRCLTLLVPLPGPALSKCRPRNGDLTFKSYLAGSKAPMFCGAQAFPTICSCRGGCSGFAGTPPNVRTLAKSQ
eukprot:scaffold185588_cov47-Prasinocladus_malaysianus.AAC.1